MDKIPVNLSDKFYFYNSAIGDLRELVMKYAVAGLMPTKGFVTNAFGVKVNTKYLPDILCEKDGEVEVPPIPANWHADIAEFGSALRAVDLASNKFTAIELGCGWGCWLNIAGIAAKNRGLEVELIGVEGDSNHVRFARESLADNGFSDGEFKIIHGIASSQSGMALFPIQEQGGSNWGLEPLFNISETEYNNFQHKENYTQLTQIPLENILPSGNQKIDLLHIDIQGGEIPLIPNSMKFLNEKVAMILIGTHSRQIEGILFENFIHEGWVLEVERPLILKIGKKIETTVDGVQLWRNPRLIPNQLINPVEAQGSVRANNRELTLRPSEAIHLHVSVFNDSNHVWNSQCNEHPTRLSYHWFDMDGNAVIFEGIRTNFDGNLLPPMTKVDQLMKVIAPDVAGAFELKITVVQEGLQWFDNLSFSTDSILVQVVAN